MSDWLEVHEVKAQRAAAAAGEPELDVVFVHGLGSNPTEAWTNTDNQHYWPQALADSDIRLRVWTLGYPAKAVDWFGKADGQPDLDAMSLGFLTKLRDEGLGKRPAVWVTHSLGGLLTKLILMKSAEREAAAACEFRHDSVVGLLFLATPHGGSAIANVLEFSLNKAKPLLGQVLISALGLPGLAAWLAEKGIAKFAKSSELIDYLKDNDDGRDTDRARFNTYFGERHRSERPLEVRVFRETEPKRVKGVSTTMVVSLTSADPKLFYDHATQVAVSDAKGHDHSTICKPKSLRDEVAKVLQAMVDRARKNEAVFTLGDPEHDRVAAMAFRMFTSSKALLDWVSDDEAGSPRELASKWARHLVGNGADSACTGLSTLAKRLADNPSRLREADLSQVRRLAGSLAVLAFGKLAEGLVPQPNHDDGPSFALPDLGSTDDPTTKTYSELLCEVLQARRAGRLARFVVQRSEGAEPELEGASPRLVANAVADPASMKAEDHLAELRGQIRGLATRPEVRKLALGLGSSAIAKPLSSFLQVSEQARARQHLRTLHARREGLWIDARAEGNPFLQQELRKSVHVEYEALLPFALHATTLDPPSNEQADALGRMVAQITDFAIHFERAQSRASQP